MDVVALAQAGFDNAVATLGTACTAEHVQKLFRFTDSVVFSFDGDAAGRRAAAPRARGEPAARQRHAHLPLPVPAARARSGQLRARARRRRRSSSASPRAVPLSRQLIELAAEGAATSPPPKGRARMLANARPLWTRLPDGVLKRQLLGEFAPRARAAGRRAGTPLAVGAASGRVRRSAAAAPPGPRCARRRAGRATAPAVLTERAGCCCCAATGGTPRWRSPRAAAEPCAGRTATLPLARAQRSRAWARRLSAARAAAARASPGPRRAARARLPTQRSASGFARA